MALHSVLSPYRLSFLKHSIYLLHSLLVILFYTFVKLNNNLKRLLYILCVWVGILARGAESFRDGNETARE